MYCPSCKKQVEDDARFCPHCGADLTAAAAAPTPQPTPSPMPAGVPPPATTPVPPPAATPVPPPATPPVPPPATTVYQAATPPPMGVPPAPAAGQPARKSSSCWIIGCIILALLVILGGVGGYFGWKYLRAKGGEIVDQLNDDAGGLVINEGDEDNQGGDNGGTSDDTSGGNSDSGNAPNEAVTVVRGMFQAWAGGDADTVLSFMTPELRNLLGGDDSPFQDSYEQLGVEFTEEEKISDIKWRFTVEETYRADSDSDTQVTVYEVEVTDQGGAAGWKVSDMSKIEDR